MTASTNPFSRRAVAWLKKADQKTHYVFGDLVRTLTNVNSRSYWNQKLQARGGHWRDFPYRNLFEFLPAERPFTLLDIGCALGDGCLLLQGQFPQAQISGADFSALAIKQAKRRSGKIEFFVLDVVKQDPPKKFDFIIMTSTLEHFNAPFLVVDKCLRFVDQALLIEVPDGGEFDNPRLYSRGQHRYLFNKHSFSGYRCSAVKETEFYPETGYRYLIFKLEP